MCVFPSLGSVNYDPDHSWSRAISPISAGVARGHHGSVDASSVTGLGERADIQPGIKLSAPFRPSDSAEGVLHHILVLSSIGCPVRLWDKSMKICRSLNSA